MNESGWLNVNKPTNCSSTKIVAIVKRITKAKKVGHGGTLDPLASGVLPICINSATKQVESVINHKKRYLFCLTFGEMRTTYDTEGDVIEKNNYIPSESSIQSVLKNFIGEIEQMPPAFSALKINGRRAYEMARNGQKVELKPRNVIVDSLQFNGFLDETTAEFVVDCGRGCYVRSLGVDIAKSL
ncbi:MAG: tRNA pseudouridine(55) synthase TruB, partial [Rickettsiales bacterium]|nr:tRNA pseudouridine(55) synthase TruB [Rickettsiales bacterium]